MEESSDDDCGTLDDSFESDSESDSNDTNHKNYGLKQRCPFNQLEAFHAVYSFPPDVLHDIMEGVVAQDLCGVIKILSEKGWYKLDDYNAALKRHTYKSFESSDKSQEILNFKAKKLPGKAVSVWTQIRNFGIIIKPLVEDCDDEVLQLALNLSEIVERITATEFRPYEIDSGRCHS